MVGRKHPPSDLLHYSWGDFVKCGSAKQHGIDRPDNCPCSKERQDLSLSPSDHSAIGADVISGVVKGQR